MVSCTLERDQGCDVSSSHPWVWLVSHPCWGPVDVMRASTQILQKKDRVNGW